MKINENTYVIRISIENVHENPELGLQAERLQWVKVNLQTKTDFGFMGIDSSRRGLYLKCILMPI